MTQEKLLPVRELCLQSDATVIFTVAFFMSHTRYAHHRGLNDHSTSSLFFNAEAMTASIS